MCCAHVRRSGPSESRGISHWGWKRPLRSSRPACDRSAPSPPDRSAGCHVQSFLTHLQGWGLRTSLGKPFQCFITFSLNKFLLMSDLRLPWPSLRRFPLLLSLFPGIKSQILPSGRCAEPEAHRHHLIFYFFINLTAAFVNKYTSYTPLESPHVLQHH